MFDLKIAFDPCHTDVALPVWKRTRSTSVCNVPPPPQPSSQEVLFLSGLPTTFVQEFSSFPSLKERGVDKEKGREPTRDPFEDPDVSHTKLGICWGQLKDPLIFQGHSFS